MAAALCERAGATARAAQHRGEGRPSHSHQGGLVFCVNHYHAGLTLDVISATLLAADRRRARTSDECAIVVGNRVRADDSARSRLLRAIAARFFRRWRANVLRVRTHTSDAPIGIAELREWRSRTATAPTLVFPEGAANGELGGMRSGVGRWLRGLRVAVIPVGVWWAEDRWRVAFGAPVAWSQRRDLLDVQLGLAMAELLPAELAPAVIRPPSTPARSSGSPNDPRAGRRSGRRALRPRSTASRRSTTPSPTVGSSTSESPDASSAAAHGCSECGRKENALALAQS